MCDSIEEETNGPAPDWNEYTRRKNVWVAENPDATCAEYDAAIRAIADELGV